MEKCDNFQNLLKLATLNDLKSFVAEYAVHDDNLRTSLTDFLNKKYNKNAETTDTYIDQMRSAFVEQINLGDRWHRYEVTDWSAIMCNVDRLIKKGWTLLEVGNADTVALMAAEFFTAFAHNFDEQEFLNETEDEYLDIATTADNLGQLLLEALTHPSISQGTKERVMDALHHFSSTDVPYSLENYGFYDFDKLITNISLSVENDEDTLTMLDRQIAQHDGQDDQHTYIERKLELLRQKGRDKEADDTEQKYIHLKEIRMVVAERMLQAKNFDGAINQAHQGMLDADVTKAPHIRGEWEKYLLYIYQTMDDKDKIIGQLRHLFIQGYGVRKEHYHELKKLIPPTQWKAYFKQLVADAQLTFSQTFASNLLADLYVEEGETEPLFNFLNTSRRITLSQMNNYSKHAGEEHAPELLGKYIELLREEAKYHASTSGYEHIAESMRAMKELKGGTAAVHKLAEEFRVQYRRRRSMMREIMEF